MKILVVHPAQQHSYRLAAALSKRGWLYKYITTVYYKKYSFTYLTSFFLHEPLKTKAKMRKCQDLRPGDVVQFCELEGLFKLLTMHSAMLHPLYRKVKYYTADKFAKKVADYAIKHHVDAVVSYDDCSAVLFEQLEERAPNILRVMDVSAANILYMRHIYDNDTALQPTFSDRLHKERAIVWDEDNIRRTYKEIEHTHIFLVPSQFVKKSLCSFGVSDKKVRMCPYGVDTQQFRQKEYPHYDAFLQRPLRFIYVGGVKELKGISYLLQAFYCVPEIQAKLIVVGQANREAEDIRPYTDRVEFTGSVLHTEIPKLLMDADVFVLPSLGEGLSLAALEAASCGLPLIVSENSGVNDTITNGTEGFVVPIQSAIAIEEKVKWFIQHPDKIEPMGRAARKMALKYSWNAYEKRICEVFEEIMQENGKDCGELSL